MDRRLPKPSGAGHEERAFCGRYVLHDVAFLVSGPWPNSCCRGIRHCWKERRRHRNAIHGRAGSGRCWLMENPVNAKTMGMRTKTSP